MARQADKASKPDGVLERERERRTHAVEAGRQCDGDEVQSSVLMSLVSAACE